MAVHPNDADGRWHITMAPNGITTIGGDHPSDVTLIGSASDLYLVLWNRGDDSTIEVVGNQCLLDTWHNGHRVRWS